MSGNRSTRLVATVFGVSAIGLGLLTACSDDSDDGTPVAQSTTTETTSTTTEATTNTAADCGDPPTGPLAVPTSSVDYVTGTAGYSVTLSDGTTQCVTVETDSSAGEYSTSGKEIDIQFGDASAGILLTIDGETAGNLPDDVPHQVADAFMGLQVDGGYFADSMHTGCDVTLTGFDDESITGTFTCTGLALFDGGPFSAAGDPSVTPQPLDTSLERAEGWFSVQT
ncbi:hypothetical protein [Williamsia sp.]|uniref:hypothetical protein n=1 Tax=Williamsia sp. TaxID=1872085 RepID=UPI002F9456B8